MTYIPALKYHFLTPIYDWFIGFTMPEIEVKTKVITLADINKGEQVLDFGCGTGTLCRILAKKHEDCTITGLDVDSKILKIAEQKRDKAGLDFSLKCFDGKTIPFEDNYFDKILCTWVMHHLPMAQKMEALKELKRVLKPSGVFVLGDWGKAQNVLMRVLFFILQIFDNFYTTSDNVNGKMSFFLETAGFNNSEIKIHRNTLFGTFEFWVLKPK